MSRSPACTTTAGTGRSKAWRATSCSRTRHNSTARTRLWSVEMLRRFVVVPAVALCVFSGTANAAPLRVLFVGNSLTSANDLPAMVTALSKVSAGPEILTGEIAPGGYALEDHWAAGGAREALDSGNWDVVVMQQGPSSLPDSRANLVEWSRRWAGDARAHDVGPALLTVWPEQYRASYAFAAVIGSYRAAALASGALLLPGGAAWRLALQQMPKLPLYGPDGFHPSPLGTFLAAVVVYGGLTGYIPAPLPAVAGVQATPKQLRLLRRAAAGALGAR